MMTHFPTQAPDDCISAYLDLVKRTIMGWPTAKLGYKTTYTERLEGKDWPDDALTLLSLSRLENIQQCVEIVLRDRIPGDLIECGVWRGGACILMSAVLHAYADKQRRVILADSFKGVPPPNAEADHKETFHHYGYLAVSKDQVETNLERFGLYKSNICFANGWFKDTLPAVAEKVCLSVLRIDGDLYSSTMECLENLYPCLSPGGFVIIDDYVCFPHVKKAVDDYRERNGITQEIAGVDWSAVYWRKW